MPKQHGVPEKPDLALYDALAQFANEGSRPLSPTVAEATATVNLSADLARHDDIEPRSADVALLTAATRRDTDTIPALQPSLLRGASNNPAPISAIMSAAKRLWISHVALVAVGIAAFGLGFVYSTYLRSGDPARDGAEGVRTSLAIGQLISTAGARSAPQAHVDDAKGVPPAPDTAPTTGTASTVAAMVREASPRPRVADARGNPPPVRTGDTGTLPNEGPAPAAFATSDGSTLSGEWSMNTRVESSGLKHYEGLRILYRLRLQQVGNQIRGTGHKVAENDRPIRPASQTPITLRGAVYGDRVVLTYSERGTLRKSAGRLVLARESDGMLRGRFSSNAAQSRGFVEARR